MAKLIVNPTSSSRREIPLPRSLLSIGRDPSNDLVLPDAMVSRRHAVIEFRSSQYFLRDCNSSNGSLVNGDRVSERSLRDGDLMAIGTARLLFREEAEALDGEAKVVQHPSAPRLECPSCQADYRKGDLFCRNCGRTLADVGPPKSVCASCGTVVPLPANFCNACGAELPDKGEKPPSIATKPQPIPEDLKPPADPAAAAAVAEPDSAADPAPRHEPSNDPSSSSELALTPPSVHAVPRPEPGRLGDELGPAPVPRPPSSVAAAAPALIVPLPRPASRPIVPRPERPSDSDRRPAPRAVAPPAELWPRLGAGLLDGFIVVLLEALVLAPGYLYWATRPQAQAPSEISFVPIAVSLLLVPLALVLGGGYYVYYWGVRGATPGKALFGLAVEAEDGSYPVGMGRAAARVLGYLLSGLVLGIGFAMIPFGGRGLHDHIAGTRVVRRGRV
jgi:uncharacterized RDD family membrane protein YckC